MFTTTSGPSWRKTREVIEPSPSPRRPSTWTQLITQCGEPAARMPHTKQYKIQKKKKKFCFFLNQTFIFVTVLLSVCAGTTEEYCCRRYQRTCGRRWGTSQPSSRSNPRTTKSGKKHNKYVWCYFTTPWTCITRLKASKVFSYLTDGHLPNTNAFRPRVFLTHWGRRGRNNSRLLRWTLECCRLFWIFWSELPGLCTSLLYFFVCVGIYFLV